MNYLLTAVSVTLILLIFGAMAMSAVTGNMTWFAAAATLDFLVICAFAVTAPESW